MIYIIKQEGLFQNKVNSNLVSTCNCKMNYYKSTEVLLIISYCFHSQRWIMKALTSFSDTRYKT